MAFNPTVFYYNYINWTCILYASARQLKCYSSMRVQRR